MKLSLFLASVAITCAVASPCKPGNGDGARIKPTIVYGNDDTRVTQPATGDPNGQDNGPRLTSLIIDPVPTGAPQMRTGAGADRWL